MLSFRTACDVLRASLLVVFVLSVPLFFAIVVGLFFVKPGPSVTTVSASSFGLWWEVSPSAAQPMTLGLPAGTITVTKLTSGDSGFDEQIPEIKIGLLSTGVELSSPVRLTAIESGACGFTLNIDPIARSEGARISIDGIVSNVALPLSYSLGAPNECPSVGGFDLPVIRSTRMQIGDQLAFTEMPGRNSPPRRQGLLREAVLQVTTRAAVFGSRIAVAKQELSAGTFVTLTSANSGEGLVWGNVNFSWDSLMTGELTTSVRAVRPRVTVHEVGPAQPYTFEASGWQWIASQPVILFAWFVFITVTSLLSLLFTAYQIVEDRKLKNTGTRAQPSTLEPEQGRESR